MNHEIKPLQERSTHERRPEEIPSLYTTARQAETSKHSVTAAASELLARSGFQPYRPEHHPAHAPPAFTLDPAYSPYHHGLYPPPHLQHAYRQAFLFILDSFIQFIFVIIIVVENEELFTQKKKKKLCKNLIQKSFEITYEGQCDDLRTFGFMKSCTIMFKSLTVI